MIRMRLLRIKPMKETMEGMPSSLEANSRRNSLIPKYMKEVKLTKVKSKTQSSMRISQRKI